MRATKKIRSRCLYSPRLSTLYGHKFEHNSDAKESQHYAGIVMLFETRENKQNSDTLKQSPALSRSRPTPLKEWVVMWCMGNGDI